MNIKNQKNLRKKYRNLRRAGQLFHYIHGPKTISKNFIFDGWSYDLGSFFIRHGHRKFGEFRIQRLLRNFYEKLRQKGYHRWIISLGESHFRPDYIYTRLRQKFPRSNVEREQRWVQRLKNRVFFSKKKKLSKLKKKIDFKVNNKITKKKFNSPYSKWRKKISTIETIARPKMSSLKQPSSQPSIKLEFIHHNQVCLNWSFPEQLFISAKHLKFFRKSIKNQILKPVNSNLEAFLKKLIPIRRTLINKKHKICFFRNSFTTLAKKKLSFMFKKKKTKIFKNNFWFILKKRILKYKIFNKKKFKNKKKLSFMFKKKKYLNRKNTHKHSSVKKIFYKKQTEEEALRIKKKNWITTQKREFLPVSFFYKWHKKYSYNWNKLKLKRLGQPFRRKFWKEFWIYQLRLWNKPEQGPKWWSRYFNYSRFKIKNFFFKKTKRWPTPGLKLFWRLKQRLALIKRRKSAKRAWKKNWRSQTKYQGYPMLSKIGFQWNQSWIWLRKRKNQIRLRRTKWKPIIHYRIVELNLLNVEEAEENELHGPGERYLLVERRWNRIGYNTLLQDWFDVLTPALKLLAQQVGHKSAKRTIYKSRSNVSLNERRRILFGWLRDLTNKNNEFNRLRRNVFRKPASKKVRIKAERGRRVTTSFDYRLGGELWRFILGDQPLIERLNDFDIKVGKQTHAKKHYRWDILVYKF